MNHDQIQWEQCPVLGHKEHGRYRGFDLHQWRYSNPSPLLCFYPSEGEATRDEISDLSKRIKTLGLDWYKPFVTRHSWKHRDDVCPFKTRLDDQEFNCCLEVHADTLEEQLTLLDEIIDALWEQSGLRPKPVELPVGRWR